MNAPSTVVYIVSGGFEEPEPARDYLRTWRFLRPDFHPTLSDVATWPHNQHTAAGRWLEERLGGGSAADPNKPMLRPIPYTDLQALASRFPGVMLALVPADGKAGGRASSGKKEAQGQEQESDTSKGVPEEHGTEAGTPNVAISFRKTATGGGQTGKQRSQIVIPMPRPDPALAVRVHKAFSRLYEEAREEARETMPERWNYKDLAIRSEMGQLDPARVWRRDTVETLILALDTSGSMGRFIDQVMTLGAAVASALPWLVIAAAPNGELNPLFPGQLHVLWNKRNFVPKGRPGDWDALARQTNAVGMIYCGDWEWDALERFQGRKAILSVYNSNWVPGPQRVDYAYGTRVPAPTVIGVNSAETFVAGLEVLISTGGWRA